MEPQAKKPRNLSVENIEPKVPQTELEEEPKDLGSFYFIRRRSNFPDVKFAVGGNDGTFLEYFEAHKRILVKESSVFAAMLNGRMIEQGLGQDEPIKIPDVDPDAFNFLLNFMYEKYMPKALRVHPTAASQFKVPSLNLNYVTAELLGHLYYAADKYNVQNLIGMCYEHMNSRIDFKDAVMIYQISNLHSLEELKTKANDFIVSNFANIVSNINGFLKFNRENLKKFLEYDYLRILEHELLIGVFKWAKQQCVANDLETSMENSLQILGDDILSLIRFHRIHRENLKEYINNHELQSIKTRAGFLELDASRGNTCTAQPSETFSDTILIPSFDDIHPTHDIAALEQSDQISDSIECTRDFKLDSLTYYIREDSKFYDHHGSYGKYISEAPFKGKILIKNLKNNEEVYIEDVTSGDEINLGEESWIEFKLNMNSTILEANMIYKIWFIKGGLEECSPSVCQNKNKKINLWWKVGPETTCQHYRNFTIQFHPYSARIRSVGFTVV